MIASPRETIVVDWEQRTDYSRLRKEWFAPTNEALETCDLVAAMLGCRTVVAALGLGH